MSSLKCMPQLKADKISDLEKWLINTISYFDRLDEAALEREKHTISVYQDVTRMWPWNYRNEYHDWLFQS